MRKSGDDVRASENDSCERTGSRNRFRVRPDAHTEIMGERASNAGAIVFSAVLFALVACLVLLAFLLTSPSGINLTAIIVAVVLATLVAMSMHIAEQWEKAVVLRLGRFNRVVGPGLYFIIPVIESTTMRIDGRVRITTFGAEETLTSDLVPLYVDAVLFWVVWDAQAACTEVSDFTCAVELAAQTALRDAIGRGEVAEVAIRRNQLDCEIKEALEEKVASWGVTVLSVEVRDIVLPEDLQSVMSLEAQANQRAKARLILMEAEQDIADMIDETGRAYAENDTALRLRAMHLLYESIRETGGTVVVPSSFSEGFGDVFPKDAAETLAKAGK